MVWKIAITTLALALQLYAVSGQKQPEINKMILPEIKRQGMTGRLNCTIIDKGDNSVSWIRRKDATTISNDEKIAIDDDKNKSPAGLHKFSIKMYKEGMSQTYQLIIRRLQETDAGQYTCQVNYRGAAEMPSKDGDMVVLTPPTIKQSATTQVKTVDRGENVTLKCNAEGYPKPNITWVRPNGMPLPAPYNKFSVRGNNLQLMDVREEDRGVYRCIADNNVKPPASYDSAMYVQFKPTAKAVQSSYGQAQNRRFDITIECRIAGFPEPNLKWYQVVLDNNDMSLEPISDDEKHVVHVLLSHDQSLSVLEFWYQLTILNVQANDYGQFVCEGSNRLGTQRAYVELYETSECQGAWCPQESQIFSHAPTVAASSLPLLALLLVSLLTL